MFGHLLKNSTIRFLCDNQAVVNIINAQSTRCPSVMTIVRPLTMKLVEHNIFLSALHIPGKSNVIPDLISPFQITQKVLQKHRMNLEPTPIPNHLLPKNFLVR